MQARSLILSLALAAVVGLTIATQGQSQSPSQGTGESPQGTAAPGRTAWGEPDLQGVWRYEAAIALERPASYQGRESLTDDEVAQIEKVEQEQAEQRLAGAEGAAVGRRSVGESPIRGNEYNSFWQDHGRPRKVLRQTSLVVDPADGRIPYTPEIGRASCRERG